MPSTEISVKKIEEHFVYVASALNDYFPDLDLRFNMRSGTTHIRCIIPEHSAEALELDLGAMNPQELLNEAILSIKVIARLFDA